jgi:hypothetical protein
MRRSLLRLGSLVLAALLGLSPTSQAQLSRDRVSEYLSPEGNVRQARTAAEWETRRTSIHASMQGIMGAFPGHTNRCPLEIAQEDETHLGTYVRRQISYQILPGVRVPAYLLVPKSVLTGGRKTQGVLTLHQTHPEGRKVVVGLGNSPDDEYAVELVKRGYVCLAPPYPMLADYWPDVKKLGFDSGTMLAIWINSRGLDLLCTLPFVETNHFGCIGHSLGGHNGIYTAAFDARIAAVVSSCGLDSYRDYYDGDPANWQPERGWCQTRYMPRLAGYHGRLHELPFDFPEVLAAIAPRRIFINAPTGDSNFRWRSVDRVVKSANEVFALFPGAVSIRVEHPDSPHRFPPEVREEAYRVLDVVLRPSR